MCPSQKTAPTVDERYRLQTTAAPSFYDLRIEPDLKNFTFPGEVTITVDLTQPHDKLVLNCADIRVHEAILSGKGGVKFIGHVNHDEENERVSISFDGTAGAGEWNLHLKFTGTINDNLKGFYRSFYKNAAGEQAVLATTKFEPCDARRAFPCFDEPAFKARFQTSLVIDEALNAVSNTRLLKTTNLGNGKKLLQFAPTIRMSSYLVAYRVGNLVATKPIMTGGKEVRVLCVPGKESMTGYALTAAKFALEFFGKYFQHPYAGDKLDLVAIPDFASGAMEDFGCISFRETALLINEKTASHAELLRVTEVIFHEIAHMWFGDFATMSWWNGLWLNEAFATFMAAKCMHAFRPDWKFWEGFNVDRAAAMKTDGLIETRSIEFPVNKPEEARGMFDILTYEKGCAILRMLELFLGEEQFRQGIINYLSKHGFGNADTPELWSAIEEKTKRFSDNVTVTDLMNTWVFQPGHPVVTVEESPVSGSVVLSQRLFRYLRGDNDPKTLFQIPVHLHATVRGASGEPETVEKVFLLSGEKETFYVGEDISSLVVNAGGNGFFRVHYSDALRQKLMDNLSVLSVSERFNFVNDMWASVQSGASPMPDYLNTLATLTGKFGETDLNVMSIVISSLNTIRMLVDCASCPTEAGQKATLGLAQRILSPTFDHISHQAVAGEAPQQAQLRGRIMATLGDLSDPAIERRTADLFAQWKENSGSVDTNLIGAVVNTRAVCGKEADYDEFIRLMNAAKTPQEENRFLMALASFRTKETSERTLKSCLDGTIRTQDAPLVLQAMLMNTAYLYTAPATAGSEKVTVSRLTWQFIKENWDALSAKYPMQGMNRMVSGITSLLSPDLDDDLKDWFATHPVKSAEKAVKQYLEQRAINARLGRSPNNAWMSDFLDGKLSPSAASTS
jgi:puromycin-sensitive aminopeptidase